MCTHHHSRPYSPDLPLTCTLQHWYAQADTSRMAYPDLPHDGKGLCIFHSKDRKWKTANHCGERFVELLEHMAADEQLADFDFREAVLLGLEVDEVDAAGTYAVREKSVPVLNLETSKPLRFQGARFLDHLVMSGLECSESVSFEGAVFKDGATFRHCQFKEFVSFGPACRFEDNVFFEGCQFEQFVSFNEVIFMKQFCMTDVHCWQVAYFDQTNQVADDLVCQFFNVRFDAYTSFSNSGYSSPVQFEYCRFGNEVHFENTAFRQRVQFIQPQVLDKIFFMGTRPGVKLFENAVDIELAEDSFGPAGQIIFQNANLFNFNPVFKEKLRTLELNQQVEVREGCMLYRTSLERLFDYSQLGKFLVEDLARVFSRFFESKYLRSLKVDVLRDLKAEKIRVIFHTDESMSIPEFEALLQDAQVEMLNFMAKPPQQPEGLFKDLLMQLEFLLQRFKIGDEANLLGQFFDQPDEKEKAQKLLGITLNLSMKNVVMNSQLSAGGNLTVGDIHNQD